MTKRTMPPSEGKKQVAKKFKSTNQNKESEQKRNLLREAKKHIDYSDQLKQPKKGFSPRDSSVEAKKSALEVLKSRDASDISRKLEAALITRIPMGLKVQNAEKKQNAAHIIADSAIKSILVDIVVSLSKEKASGQNQKQTIVKEWLQKMGLEASKAKEYSDNIKESGQYLQKKKIREAAGKIDSVYRVVGMSPHNLRPGDEYANQRLVSASFDPILSSNENIPTIDEVMKHPEKYYDDKTMNILNAAKELHRKGLISEEMFKAAVTPAYDKTTKKIVTSGIFIGPGEKDVSQLNFNSADKHSKKFRNSYSKSMQRIR